MRTSPWRQAWRQIGQRRLHRFCLAVLAVYLGVAVYGEVVYQTARLRDRTPGYQVVDQELAYLPPVVLRAWMTPATPAEALARERAGRWRHPLGTDALGRDVLQRLIQGARIAFRVGVLTAAISIPIGLTLGLVAGYFEGRVDDLIVWIYSTFASIPEILFILSIALIAGRGLSGVYLGIGLTTWVGLCRLIRGEVLKHKQRPYIQAARALGFGHLRILFRHLLPNVMHIVVITFTLRFPAAIGTEVFMSFLGIGVQGEPSWGTMISDSRLRLWYGYAWEISFVTLAIFLVVLAFNVLGDALRDALDPRLRRTQV